MKRICMVLVLAVITAAVCGCGSGKQEASTNIVSEFSDIIKTYYIQKDTGAEELADDMFQGCTMDRSSKLFDLDWDRKYLHGGH